MAAVWHVHLYARGWGLITIELPALSETNVLDIAVEVGFVVGRIAATTPTGTPISTIFSSGNSRRMPTVFIPRILRGSTSQASRFFRCLSRALPYPVSSTANAARRSEFARAA